MTDAVTVHLVLIEDVQIGDVIADLGFTITRIDKLSSMFGEPKPIQLWSDRDHIWMQTGREIKVHRPT